MEDSGTSHKPAGQTERQSRSRAAAGWGWSLEAKCRGLKEDSGTSEKPAVQGAPKCREGGLQLAGVCAEFQGWIKMAFLKAA